MSVEYPARDHRFMPSAERSISSLLEDLSEVELQQLAVDVIVQNRIYLQRAQTLFEKLGEQETGRNDLGTEAVRHDYHLAVLTLHGHHSVVKAVIDALGYVPDVPEEPVDASAVSGLN